MVRSFLERNKIIFEVISSILLASMAIIVSLNANSVAESQLKIAEKTQDLSMLSHLPNVRAQFKYIESNNGVRKEDLLIVNDGDSLFEFNSKPIAFLKLNELEALYPDQEPNPNLIRYGANLPIDSYFPNVEFHLNSNKGTIVKTSINDVNLLNVKTNKFEELYQSDIKSINSYIERFLAVSYKDKFGNNHKKYFKFGYGGDSIPIEEKEGKVIFSKYAKIIKAGDAIDFKKSTYKDINNIWLKYKEKI